MSLSHVAPSILPPTRDNIALCQTRLKEGKIVAFPTETVYGLGANATMTSNVQDIFKLKGRPSSNPLICHVSKLSDILPYVDTSEIKGYEENESNDWSLIQSITSIFWPGPLSIVFPLKQSLHNDDNYSFLSQVTTANGRTVCFRVPSHPISRELINGCRIRLCEDCNLKCTCSVYSDIHQENCNFSLDKPCRYSSLHKIVDISIPIAAPSANVSGRPSPTRAEHVLYDFNNFSEYPTDYNLPILEGDDHVHIGIESTVIQVLNGIIHILRPGHVSINDLMKFNHPVKFNGELFLPQVYFKESDNQVREKPADRSKDEPYSNDKVPKSLENSIKESSHNHDIENNTLIVSPGTHFKHYCPEIPVFLIKKIEDIFQYTDYVDKSALYVEINSHKNHEFLKDNFQVLSLPSTEEMQLNLYDIFRKYEFSKSVIFVNISNIPETSGLYNRLSKAASGI